MRLSGERGGERRRGELDFDGADVTVRAGRIGAGQASLVGADSLHGATVWGGDRVDEVAEI